MENNFERYCSEKKRFYNKLGAGDFDLKTRLLKAEKITGAEELGHTHNYRVLRSGNREYVIKIPRAGIAYKSVEAQYLTIQAHNRKHVNFPVIFPKTELCLLQAEPEVFYIKQEYIEGKHLSLALLMEDPDVKQQFIKLFTTTFKLLQEQPKVQVSNTEMFHNLLLSLKFGLLGKKISMDELLRNFIVDKYGIIRVVSLHVLDMDIEALHFQVQNKIKALIKIEPIE